MSSIASSIVGEDALLSGAVWVISPKSYPASMQALDVLGEHVDLEVDLVARLERAERRHFERVRDQRDLERVVVERGDGERDAVDGDRALLDAVAQDLRGRPRPSTTPSPSDSTADAADAVDVALDEVAAERLARAQRGLEVDLVPGGEPAEGRAVSVSATAVNESRPSDDRRSPSGRRR